MYLCIVNLKFKKMNSLYITLGAIGLGEWVLPLLLIILIFFGGKKIPELMKGLGGGIKEFKKAAKGEDDAPVAKKEEVEDDKK
jgi:sec-independent protein translocase protein TatA